MSQRISCIYIIFNKINNKFYLGSTNDFTKRKKEHLRQLLKNKHHSKYLQRAFNLYGVNNFTIDIYQYCNKKDLLNLEQYYLNIYKPKYNVSKSAICPMLGRKHNKSTIEKFKKRTFPKGTLSPNWGRKHTEEFKEKRRQARIGYKHKNSTILKMKETAKKINPIARIDRTKSYRKILDSNGNLHESLTKCAEFWKISPATVCDILKGRHSKTRKGISFKYA